KLARPSRPIARSVAAGRRPRRSEWQRRRSETVEAERGRGVERALVQMLESVTRLSVLGIDLELGTTVKSPDDHVQAGGRLRRRCAERSDAAAKAGEIEMVGLADLAEESLNTASGGDAGIRCVDTGGPLPARQGNSAARQIEVQ